MQLFKGRSIFDAIRTIDKIVDYTKQKRWSGSGFMTFSIDFEKAFDTLDFQFLNRTLHKLNFRLPLGLLWDPKSP